MSPFLWRRPSETISSIKPSPMARGGGRKEKRPVEQLTKDGQSIRQFPSLRAASINSGVPDSNILRAASGMRKTAGGYRWRYLSAAEQVLADRFGGAYSKAAPSTMGEL